MSGRKPLYIKKAPAYVRLPAGVRMRDWLRTMDKKADAARGKTPDGRFSEANFNYLRSKSFAYLKKQAPYALTLKRFRTFASFKVFVQRYVISKRCFNPEYRKAFERCVKGFGAELCMKMSGGEFYSRIKGDRPVYTCRVARAPSLPPVPARRRRPPRVQVAKSPRQKSIHEALKQLAARSKPTKRIPPKVPLLLALKEEDSLKKLIKKRDPRLEMMIAHFLKIARTSKDPQKRWQALDTLATSFFYHPKVVAFAVEMLKLTPAQARKQAAIMFGGARVGLALLFKPSLLTKGMVRIKAEALKTLSYGGGAKEVKDIAPLLTHGNKGIREAAIRALKRIYVRAKRGTIVDPNPAPIVLMLTKGTRDRARVDAVRVLGMMTNTNTESMRLSALIAALQDSYDDVVHLAMGSLAQIGKPWTLPYIAKFLKDKRSRLRARAAYYIGLFKDPASRAKRARMLMKLLGDTDPRVKGDAATSLGRLRWRKATKRLIALLKIRDSSLQRSVVRALGRVGGPRIRAQLLATMILEHKKSSNPYVNTLLGHRCFRTLIRMGAAGTKAVIAQLGKHGDAMDRYLAENLGTYGVRSAVPALVTIALSDRLISTSAVWALRKIRDVQALKMISRVLIRDPDKARRKRAAQVLMRLRNRRVTPALRLAAKADPDPAVRKQAALALKRLK